MSLRLVTDKNMFYSETKKKECTLLFRSLVEHFCETKYLGVIEALTCQIAINFFHQIYCILQKFSVSDTNV